MRLGAFGIAVLAASPVFAQAEGPAGLVDQCGGVRLSVALSGDAPLTMEETQAAADVLTARLPGLRMFGRNMVAGVDVVSEGRLGLYRAGRSDFAVPNEVLFAGGDHLSIYDVIAETDAPVVQDGAVVLPVPDVPGAFLELSADPVIEVLETASAVMIFDPSNRPAIAVRLSEESSAAFCAASGARVGEMLAVVYDGAVMTAPRVMEAICGQSVMISGSFMLEEAQQLADELSAGTFPYDVQIVDETIVEPRDAGASECAGVSALGD